MKTITILLISVMLLSIASAGIFGLASLTSVDTDLTKEQTDILTEKSISKLTIVELQDSKNRYYEFRGDINKPLITIPKQVCKVYDGKKVCRDITEKEIDVILERATQKVLNDIAPVTKTGESKIEVSEREVVLK